MNEITEKEKELDLALFSNLSQLIRTTNKTITSVSVLKSHGVDIEYPTNVLMALHQDLQEYQIKLLEKERINEQNRTDEKNKTNEQNRTNEQDNKSDNKSDNEFDFENYKLDEITEELQIFEETAELIRIPKEKSLEIPEDALCLYAKYSSSKQSKNFMSEYVNAIANSTQIKNFSSETGESQTLEFLTKHAIRIAKNNVDLLIEKYIGLVKPKNTGEDNLPRILIPKKSKTTESKTHPLLKDNITAEEIINYLSKETHGKNIFSASRILDFDHKTNKLTRGVAEGLQEIDKFYGYVDIKSILEGQFRDFASGKKTRPIIMEGPPGVGKTQLIQAYSMHFPTTHLVRTDQHALENLKDILDFFEKEDAQTVLFIDDVDSRFMTDEVVGNIRRIYESGKVIPPENVLLVVASNESFPQNIRSRGFFMPFSDISDAKTGYQTALGIIRDYTMRRYEGMGFKPDMDKARELHAKVKNNTAIDKEKLELMALLKKKKKYEEIMTQQKAYIQFVAQHFYKGDMPEQHKHIWQDDDLKTIHNYELSPRGLINYLADLDKGNYVQEIRTRMNSAKEMEDSFGGLESKVGDVEVQVKTGMDKIERLPEPEE